MVALQSPVVVGAKAGDVSLESTTSFTWDGCRPANSTFSRLRHSNVTTGSNYVAEFLMLCETLSLYPLSLRRHVRVKDEIAEVVSKLRHRENVLFDITYNTAALTCVAGS